MSLEQNTQLTPERFQQNLAKLSLEQRFLVVENLSESEKQRLSVDVNYTDGTQTFVTIPADNLRAKDIYIITDPLDYNESKADEARLLPVWRSEQAVYQEWGQQFIYKIIKEKLELGEKLTTVDVGCGSGISSLWLQSFCHNNPDLQVRNVVIDLSPRAVLATDKNARLNGWNDNQIEILLAKYSLDSMAPQSSDIIFLAPPYNPRPSIFSDTLTPHADGWNEEADENFIKQLETSMYHLAPGGVILINQMLPIERETREYWMNKYFGGYPDILVNNIKVYAPIDSQEFLDEVYPDEIVKLLSQYEQKELEQFKKRISDKYSHFSYNIFAIEKYPADITGYPATYKHYGEFTTTMFQKGSWQEDRIPLHREINRGMIKRRVK